MVEQIKTRMRQLVAAVLDDEYQDADLTGDARRELVEVVLQEHGGTIRDVVLGAIAQVAMDCEDDGDEEDEEEEAQWEEPRQHVRREAPVIDVDAEEVHQQRRAQR